MSLGDPSLRETGPVEARRGTIRPRSSSRRHEPANHLDALLHAGLALSCIRRVLSTGACHRHQRVCTAAISDLGAGSTSQYVPEAVADGSPDGRMAVAASHGRSLPDRDAQTLRPRVMTEDEYREIA